MDGVGGSSALVYLPNSTRSWNTNFVGESKGLGVKRKRFALEEGLEKLRLTSDSQLPMTRFPVVKILINSDTITVG